ncbi:MULTISPECIES: hypothetical protein [unclassified Lentimonas]|uniref:hypothetical protein n=1 Tax=unclassified Lentimonas TaxID=2630993 RepID=UPI001324586A|nr:MULTISPECIES: hypothetical protein [unclassified Lentimonas]CAA6678140.1 Unannotated [Lentimonas sp. CC4]CAA6685971.1 Unannotated [Lentimonas sp. CC6]CAA6691825.1 Unannotated [Lentimonas sp. CC19]CAA6694573.1 Unannotated [Lentimonas sp. CC10]CAA7072113.1 Unannotated [Lentimonas sp. CC11]
MGFIRRIFCWLKRSDPARKAARSHLKAAKRGDREQYLALAANYTDLAQTFFGCSFSEPTGLRMARVTQLFNELWQNLPYAERLSDFEFMLAQALIDSTSDQKLTTSKQALVTKLRLLNAPSRFACLAYAFGNWPLRWVALVMRIKTPALHSLLSQARCELCSISWESLSSEERECLEAISATLDTCSSVSANKALNKRTSKHPRVMEIKAQWLELRPELVEVRMRYVLNLEDREELLSNILDATAAEAMQRPALVDRMVNTVHFSRHSKIKVS